MSWRTSDPKIRSQVYLGPIKSRDDIQSKSILGFISKIYLNTLNIHTVFFLLVAVHALMLLMHWYCWCADAADAADALMSDAADALMLLVHSSCWCADVADALMHLGYCTESRSESFAHLSIAFYSSFSCFEGSLVFSPFDIFLVPLSYNLRDFVGRVTQ